MFVQFLCFVVALSNEIENYSVQAKHQAATKVFEDIITHWFPEDAEFNESCVCEGCPGLINFSLCPNDINITILHSVLSTAIGCMRRPICGILIDNRPTINFTANTDEVLPGMEIDGVCKAVPGIGYLSNVSNIEFDFLPDHNQTHQLPLQFTMFISNLRYFGTLQLEFSLRTMLPSIIGQALTVNLPDVKYDVTVEYASTISINRSLTDSGFEIKISNAIIKTRPTFCGLDMPQGFPNILTLFSSMTQIIIDNSSWAVRKSVFLEKYFQNAFGIASNSC